MKSLELTKENINVVSLEMTRNKKLFDENINHVIGFMLRHFPERSELLSKLKVLNIKSKSADRIDVDAGVMEQIAMNVFAIKGINEADFMKNMLLLFEDLSTFSRAFLVYFYKNSDLNPLETSKILDALAYLLLQKVGLERVFEDLMDRIHDESESLDEDDIDDDGEVGKSGAIESQDLDEASADTVISLMSLEDSDEIRRIDMSLSTMFNKNGKSLSDSEHMVCTKILDVMEVIMKNNYLNDTGVIPALLCVSGTNRIIFKRVLSVVRTVLKKVEYENKKELFEMFCHCLEWNADLVKMTMLIVDTCGEDFDWPMFLEVVESNTKIDLGMVDRTYIPTSHFYKFLGEVGDIQRFTKVAKNIIKNEVDVEALVELNELISGRPDEQCIFGIRNYAFQKIKSLQRAKKTRNNVENQEDVNSNIVQNTLSE